MAGVTITSANAVYMLVIPGVFPTPVQLQQFAVDEAFDTEMAPIAETQVGVDGEGVAGWIPREVPQTIAFLASSPSVDIMNEWIRAMDQQREIIYASCTIRIDSIGLKFNGSKGVLRRYPTLPNVRRVLQPPRYEVVWLPSLSSPALTAQPA